MTDKKIKVLTLGDHPLAFSGVGIQTRNMIEALLKSDKFQVFSIGGAIKHSQYNIMQTEEYGEDWKVLPVDNFGTKDLLRSIIRKERPDMLWFMTDPRFWGWLWEMENEIRPLMPMIYYHVWDNYPYPRYNRPAYLSNDVIVSISQLTNDLVKNVAPEVELHHIPHAVDSEIYKYLGADNRKKIRETNVNPSGASLDDKFIILWCNRNARRKHSGTLILWFKEFLDIVGKDKATLIMHTDPFDSNGPNLQRIIEDLDLLDGEVLFSRERIPLDQMGKIYNMADCVVNISDAEGFGLSTLEAMSCEVPIISIMTGGLQDQVKNGDEECGIPLYPCSQQIVGSQQVPYIYEDRISKQDFLDALLKVYNMTDEEKTKLTKRARKHVKQNFNFKDFNSRWVNLMENTYKKYGSWETRKGYEPWKAIDL
tara:strand:+ start:5794 stop:7065 length:1272 start_codon:yes stop_codon:yes gene_type:complete